MAKLIPQGFELWSVTFSPIDGEDRYERLLDLLNTGGSLAGELSEPQPVIAWVLEADGDEENPWPITPLGVISPMRSVAFGKNPDMADRAARVRLTRAVRAAEHVRSRKKATR